MLRYLTRKRFNYIDTAASAGATWYFIQDRWSIGLFCLLLGVTVSIGAEALADRRG